MKISHSFPQHRIKFIHTMSAKQNQKAGSNKIINKKYSLTDANGYYNRQLLNVSFGTLKVTPPISIEERYKGCLFGGAIGDALGIDVEFMDVDHIKRCYGDEGVQDLELGMSGEAEFSDDTQMTIFTIDGLLKSIGDKFDTNIPPQIEDMHEAYLNWYKTQIEPYSGKIKNDGWIVKSSGLYRRMSPGETCLSSLRSGKVGTTKKPINNSKGNGGVMRVAPIGLLYHHNPELAFKVGMDNAAITHGHPSAYLSAGFMAALIANITNDFSLEDAIKKSLSLLEKQENSEEVIEKINTAKKLAKEDITPEQAIKSIGQGWTADEAIGISVYCALKSPHSYEDAIKMSVNHSGDSDTIGAITGNIMGTLLGVKSIPANWMSKIQDKKLLKTIAEDLIDVPNEPQKHKSRYPYNRGRVPNWYEKSLSIPTEPRRLDYSFFTESDILKMKDMTTDEVISYKKFLLKNRTI